MIEESIIKGPIEIDLNEFRDFGFLQEANRRFFHPLGLALFVRVDGDGKCISLGCQDGRDDPEGFCFTGVDNVAIEKVGRVQALLDRNGEYRRKLFGYVVQELEGG